MVRQYFLYFFYLILLNNLLKRVCLCVYVCVNACMYVSMRACVFTHVHTCVRECMHACVLTLGTLDMCIFDIFMVISVCHILFFK